MKYVDAINNFWAKQFDHTSADVAIYFYILNVFNTYRWADCVRINAQIVPISLNISKKTFNTSLNKLVDIGLLYLERVNGSKFISCYLNVNKPNTIPPLKNGGVGVQVEILENEPTPPPTTIPPSKNGGVGVQVDTPIHYNKENAKAFSKDKDKIRYNIYNNNNQKEVRQKERNFLNELARKILNN